MTKQYYNICIQERTKRDETAGWIEYHTGTDRAEVMHAKSLNSAMRIEGDGTCSTMLDLARFMERCHREACLYEMEPVAFL